MSYMVSTARRRLDDLASAVYETVFYDAMDAILNEGLWHSYVHEVTGKTYSFNSMDEFLTSDNGLGVQDPGLFQECIKAVGATGGHIGPMAKALLKRLERECGMTMVNVNAESALTLPDPEHFAKEGRPTEENCDNVTVRSQGDGGNSAAYLAARLKKTGRDDLLEQVKAGEIKSIRAAAIEAGIIKPVPTVRIVEDLEKVAENLRKHLNSEQLSKLLVLLQNARSV